MFVILFLIWIMFNGAITVEIAVFGVVISLIVLLFMCKFLDYSLKKELILYQLIPLLILYFITLVWEILKANVDTAKLILNPKVEVESQVVMFKSDLKTDFCRVILANSITLTPGTITAKITKDGEFIIHALDSSFTEGLDESVFVKKLRVIESKMEAVR